jgi:hypothetical protein
MSSDPSSSSVPSMQVVGLTSSDQRLSAIESTNNKANILNTLNQTGGIYGRKMRKLRKMKSRRMRGGEITIPMPTPLYTETLAGDMGTTGQVTGNAVLMTGSAENAKYDSLAAPVAPVPANQLKGGYRKKRTKKRKSSKMKKSSKSRKSRKSRK